MAYQRKPLTIPLVSRDDAVAKDGRLQNCYSENGPLGPMVVKRAGIVTQNATGAGCAQGAATFNGEALFIKSDTLYSDLQPFAAGSSWTAVTSPTKPSNGSSIGTAKPGYLVSLDGNLYSIGGKDNADATYGVYKSTDNGTSWATALAATPFTDDLQFSNIATALGTRIFILNKNQSTGFHECWSSADGAVWTKLSTNMGASGSQGCFALITHGTVLFAFFGSASGGTGQVWYSADGVTWASATTSPAWAGREGYVCYSLDGTLYLAAGINGASTLLNDVYKSTDQGVTWTQITAAAAFSARQYPAGFVYNSKLWIMGGATNSGGTVRVNDVYSSTDGITWTLATAAAGWSARYRMSHTVHNNTMYIGPGTSNNAIISGLQYAAQGGATSTALTTPTQNCLPVQVALIPANGAVVAKAFIKSTKDAWVWDGTTITKVTDVDYPATTVPGAANLDGAIYVMDAKGVIYGSDLIAPIVWSALNFISAIAEADAGVAIARQLDTIIAFKETSTEFFYDAGNPTGSPLSKMPNALLEVGCASAASLAYSDNTLFFMSQHKQKGRSVMKFEGTTPKQVSTPWVDRILDGDSLATIYAFVVRTNGHVFYFLTLRASAITLVYDDTMNDWHTATKLSAYPAATVTSAVVQADGSILVTMPLPHGAGDGDPVVIAGATPTAANGSFNLRYDTSVMSATQFSYVPATAVSGSITGTITATLYTSSYFPGAYYARSSTADLILDESSGNIYRIDPAIYQDLGNPIDMKIRTEREDFGSLTPKTYNALTVVADNPVGKMGVRYTNDDYSTFSKYRLVDLSKKRPRLTQLGSAERRAWEFRYTENTALRVTSADPDIQGWKA